MVDSSLAAMQFMLAARAHGYDTNPIAGYDAKKAATALGLDPERYVPVMAIAVGKADSESTDIKSTRYSVDDVIEFLFVQRLIGGSDCLFPENATEISSEIFINIRVIRIEALRNAVDEPIHACGVPVAVVFEILTEKIEYLALLRIGEFHRRPRVSRVRIRSVDFIVLLDIFSVMVHPPVQQVRSRGRPAHTAVCNKFGMVAV